MTGHGFLTGTLGFTVYLVAILGLLRLPIPGSPALVVVGTAIVVYVGTAAAGAALVAPVPFWAMSATYWFLALCFLMAFGAIYKSISLRILLHLLDRPDRAERRDAIMSRYVQTDSYRGRLEVLITQRLATRERAAFRLTPRGQRIAAVAAGCQRLFRIEQSG